MANERTAEQAGETSGWLAHENMDDVKVAYMDVSEMTKERIENICDLANGAALVIGFVSPACDMENIGACLKEFLPSGVQLMMVSTAGEICRVEGEDTLYRPVHAGRHKLVLQSFSRRMIRGCQIFTVPLPNEDLKQGKVQLSAESRMEIIREQLERQKVEIAVNSQDTVALAYIDGVAMCESFVMQAVYESKRFPCIFIGGSAGGDLNFSNTYLYDGKRVLENHLMICLLKFHPGYKFGIFKSQGFERTSDGYIIADGNPSLRYVSKVLDENEQFVDFIAALKRRFCCATVKELESIIYQYSFAIEVNGEIFARTILKIDEEKNRVYFYCDIGIGEKLHIIRRASFLETMQRDWLLFMENKPKPFAGLLNDCITRRQVNAQEIHKLDLFSDVTIGGFSCFGEYLGIPMNDTLTAIFFFRVAGEEVFRDKYYDSFPIYYGEFKSYFLLRRLKQMQIISDLESKVMEFFNQYSKSESNGKINEKMIQEDIDSIFAQLINGFRFDESLESRYKKSERKMLEVLQRVERGLDQRAAFSDGGGDIGTLVSYMQVVLHELSMQREELEQKVLKMEQSVSRYAKDELTNVYTRRSGYEIIHRMLKEPSENIRFLTLAFMDLDNLKVANDRFGHEEGDFYLKTVVSLLLEHLESEEFVCRYGGDEFIVVFPNQTAEYTAALLNCLNQKLHIVNHERGKNYQMSFAFGVMTYDYHSDLTFDDVMKILDSKMYQYKSVHKIVL